MNHIDMARAFIYAKHSTVNWEMPIYLMENIVAVNSFTVFCYVLHEKKKFVFTLRFSYSTVSI